MKLWQILLLSAIVLALLAGIILGWGSAGSALCAFLLVIMGGAVLVKHFLIERQNDDYQADV